MIRLIFVGLVVFFVQQVALAQKMDSLRMKQQSLDSLKKWEISLVINTPEPLTTAGFDYNALTQRIFVNGDRKEFSVDGGIGCARKLRNSLWLNLNVNYAYYYAHEQRDSRVFTPPVSEYGLDTLNIDQSSMEILSGLFKRFTLNKFQFDFGLQLRYKLFSEIHGTTSYDLHDGTYFQRDVYYQTEPGGYAIGLSPSLRINYNLRHSFSIGVKISSYVTYYKTGGTISTYKTVIVSTFPPQYSGPSTSEQSFEGLRVFPCAISFQLIYLHY